MGRGDPVVARGRGGQHRLAHYRGFVQQAAHGGAAAGLPRRVDVGRVMKRLPGAGVKSGAAARSAGAGGRIRRHVCDGSGPPAPVHAPQSALCAA